MKDAIDKLKDAGKYDVDDDHDWGYQLRVHNNDQYCAKYLVLENFTHGSHHRHKEKVETFNVMEGELYIKGSWGRVLLKPGDAMTFTPDSNVSDHEMWAKSLPCVVLEISTHDDDSDIVKEIG